MTQWRCEKPGDSEQVVVVAGAPTAALDFPLLIALDDATGQIRGALAARLQVIQEQTWI